MKICPSFFSLPTFVSAKKNKILSEDFIERIMLAVTEVNGCEVCLYAHTKMALEAGMTNEENRNIQIEEIEHDVI